LVAFVARRLALNGFLDGHGILLTGGC